jgi:choline-glycine betaine transporter
MNIPWFLILIFIALSFFYYFSQKARIKREQRRLRYEEKQQELVEMLQKHSKETIEE